MYRLYCSVEAKKHEQVPEPPAAQAWSQESVSTSPTDQRMLALSPYRDCRTLTWWDPARTEQYIH